MIKILFNIYNILEKKQKSNCKYLCVQSLMKNKTRIIVSHNKKVLDYCEKIYEIKNKSLVIIK